LESLSEYKKAEQDSDVKGLLELIKDLVQGTHDKKYPPMQAVAAWRSLTRCWQENDDLVTYHKQFVSLVEVVEKEYGTICPPVLMKKNQHYGRGTSAAKVAEATAEERDRFLAAMFLDGANKSIYGGFLKSIGEDYALGGKQVYPDNVEEALQLLMLQEELRTKKKKNGDDDVPKMSFAQFKGKCFKCKKQGHRIKECPEWDKEKKSEEKPVSGLQVVMEEDHDEQHFGWVG